MGTRGHSPKPTKLEPKNLDRKPAPMATWDLIGPKKFDLAHSWVQSMRMINIGSDGKNSKLASCPQLFNAAQPMLAWEYMP